MILALYLILEVLSFRLVAEKPRFLQRNGTTRLALNDLVTEAVNREVKRIIAQPADAQRSEITPRLTLLTSFFFKEDHGHWAELAGALHVNLHNPLFEEVHVLMESSSKPMTPDASECGMIQEKISQALHGAEWSTEVKKRLVCVPVSAQPNYARFFDYANSELAGKLVVLANTDIAFDDSLGLIDPAAFGSGKFGYVISVQPPPYGGEYSRMFGTECESETRCTNGAFDGWEWGGNSWDAYVFQSPLQGMDVKYLNHFMNTLGGENRAAYQVEKVAGLPLSNPCKHIHAFHWHCSGGKMHATNDRIDTVERYHAVKSIMPCWDCPGMRLPQGKASLKDLCAKGTRQPLESTSLHVSVKMPSCTAACLSASGATPTALCEGSDDVDCIISECGSTTSNHCYY